MYFWCLQKILFQLDQLNRICAPHLISIEDVHKDQVEFAQRQLTDEGIKLREAMDEVLEEKEPVTIYRVKSKTY